MSCSKRLACASMRLQSAVWRRVASVPHVSRSAPSFPGNDTSRVAPAAVVRMLYLWNMQ